MTQRPCYTRGLARDQIVLLGRAPLRPGSHSERSPLIASIPAIERTSEPPRLQVGSRVRELLAHREVLVNLVRKELKVKYTASVLGAVWSLLNPVVFLAVFSFVVIVLGNTVPGLPRVPAVGTARVELLRRTRCRPGRGP